MHAKLSPSSAHRWLACPGSVALSATLPPQGDVSSEHADEGTAAHELASMALRDGNDAKAYIGYILLVKNEDGSVRARFTVDAEMAGFVQVYLDTVRDAIDTKAGDMLLVEQAVGGEAQTRGTADAIVLKFKAKTLAVFDLKYGRGHVVEAGDNPQLSLYGYHALEDTAMLGEFDFVDMAIVQPRCDHTSHAVDPDGKPLSAAFLREWYTSTVEPCVALIQDNLHAEILHPSDDACRWCPAKAICPALRDQAMNAALVDFADVPDLTERGLAGALDKLAIVKAWVESIETAARATLEAGLPIPGWCLVEGRQGNRKWKDEAAVEALLKAMRLKQDEMYKSRLISPTEAEKMLSTKRYASLAENIERGPPSMKIVRGDGTDNKALKDFGVVS